MAKPKILLVTPWAPYPYDGGSKRIWSLCKALRERYAFTLLTFASRPDGARAAADDLLREHRLLRPVFDKIIWVDRRGEPQSQDRSLPEDVRRFASPAMERALRETVARENPALVHVEYDLMAPYGRLVEDRPVMLTQHDVGTISFFQSYFREMAGWRKFTRVPTWLRRVAFERRAMRWYRRVVVMTEPDKKRLSRIMPAARVRVCPTGVDLAHFEGERRAPAAPTLVFLGHYPHYPNEDAALHLADDIVPRIRARRPDLRVVLVGSSPTPRVDALAARPGFVVTGTVEDVKPFLAQGSVFVAPLRMGQGIKGKILEAWALGLPVVATPRAADGLEAAPGRDLLVAREPESFAARVLELLDDPARAAALGAAGREAARRTYGWDALAGRVAAVYEELIARPDPVEAAA